MWLDKSVLMLFIIVNNTFTCHIIASNTGDIILEWGSGLNELNGSVKEPNKFHIYETEESLVKPVTRQNISRCSVLSPEIIMHDASNVIKVIL